MTTKISVILMALAITALYVNAAPDRDYGSRDRANEWRRGESGREEHSSYGHESHSEHGGHGGYGSVNSGSNGHESHHSGNAAHISDNSHLMTRSTIVDRYNKNRLNSVPEAKGTQKPKMPSKYYNGV